METDTYVVFAPNGTMYFPPMSYADSLAMIRERSIRPDEQGWRIVAAGADLDATHNEQRINYSGDRHA